ncbi:TonB family protein [bacterium]|nr:MAG: TonB family protein [bacterium]
MKSIMKILEIILFLFLFSSYGFTQQSNMVFVTESYLLARVVERGQLIYPEFAESPRVPGKVIFAVVVDENGNLEQSAILSGYRFLDQSAQNYLQTWKFLPLRDQHIAYKMSSIITVWFDFVSNKPIRGLELPTIKVMGADSFIVEGKTINFVQLRNMIDSENVRDKQKMMHLIVKDPPSEQIIRKLMEAGVRDICIHSE